MGILKASPQGTGMLEPADDQTPSSISKDDRIPIEILRYLRLCWDTAPGSGRPFIVPLAHLAEHFGISRHQSGVHLFALETAGLIKRVQTREHDPNPGYYITALGHATAALES